MITNLTEGKPSRVLWRFSMPMLLSILFQQLYNMADSAVVGRFVNENALSAVGVSYPITMIFMAVAAGSSVGGSVVISRLFGGGEVAQMRTAIGTTLWSMGAVSVVLTVVGLVFCPQLLALVGTPSEIFADAAAYLRIYSLGLVFLFLYNSTNAVFTALGDSRTPLLFLIGSSVGNIVLDLIFVIRFDWGVPGVAWATLIAQGGTLMRGAAPAAAHLRRDAGAHLLLRGAAAHRHHGPAQHFAAELCLGGQPVCPDHGQLLRRGVHRRVFGGHPAQHLCHHLFFHPV